MGQTIKNLLKKTDPLTWQVELPNILMMLHVTPNPVTGKTPSELLMGRCIRTLLDKCHPASMPRMQPKTQQGDCYLRS
jgi:hypothetical protein